MSKAPSPEILATGMALAGKDPVTMWFEAAGRYRPLTKGDVVDLSRVIHDPEAKECHKKKAADKLFVHNLLLVGHTATKFIQTKTHLQMWDDRVVDYLQAGAIGLHTAVRKYDGSKGFAFSTYAVPWIRQKLNRHHMTQFGMMHVPENVILMTCNPNHKDHTRANSKELVACALRAKNMLNLNQDTARGCGVRSAELHETVADNTKLYEPEDVAISAAVETFNRLYPDVAKSLAENNCSISRPKLNEILKSCW